MIGHTVYNGAMIDDGGIHDAGTAAVTNDTVNIVYEGTVGKGE